MYLIAAFGFLMMLLSLVMAIKPESFADGIIALSKKSCFHPFEVISRIIAGVIFVVYSSDTVFPRAILIIGYTLIVVGIGLAVTPARFHKKFAVWSANSFRGKFRLIGIASIPLSLLLIYCATGI